jgi:hypothetical protein
VSALYEAFLAIFRELAPETLDIGFEFTSTSQDPSETDCVDPALARTLDVIFETLGQHLKSMGTGEDTLRVTRWNSGEGRGEFLNLYFWLFGESCG